MRASPAAACRSSCRSGRSSRSAQAHHDRRRTAASWALHLGLSQTDDGMGSLGVLLLLGAAGLGRQSGPGFGGDGRHAGVRSRRDVAAAPQQLGHRRSLVDRRGPARQRLDPAPPAHGAGGKERPRRATGPGVRQERQIPASVGRPTRSGGMAGHRARDLRRLQGQRLDRRQ